MPVAVAQPDESLDALIARADGAMYEAACYALAGKIDLARRAAETNGVERICRFRRAEVFAELERLGEDRASWSEWDAQAHGDG